VAGEHGVSRKIGDWGVEIAGRRKKPRRQASQQGEWRKLLACGASLATNWRAA